MAALVLVLSDDLLFTSRVTGAARDQGLAAKTARNPAALEALARQQAPGCVLLDLANPGLVLEEFLPMLKAIAPKVYLVGYGSHVDTATLQAARTAGCNLVLPRSRFVEELPRQLSNWVASGGASDASESPA
jgi:DNA-binding NarL/FixJ family response regulator